MDKDKTMLNYSTALMLFFCLLLMQPAFANDNADSLKTMKVDGKNFALHKVEAGETLYSISRKYNVELAELIVVNRIGETGYTISVNEMLMIPLYAAKEANEAVPEHNTAADGYLTHIVKQGETLYSISRSYNGVTLAMIKEKNKIQGDTVRINQKLLIPTGIYSKDEQAVDAKPPIKSPEVINDKPAGNMVKEKPEPNKKDDPLPGITDVSMLEQLHRQFQQVESDSSLPVEVDRGIATWLNNDRQENNQNFYALHKYAPIGSVIKVRNLMNNRIVYVKVIGKLPETDENRSLVIKMSRAAARYLNVLDEKFLVELILPNQKS